MPWRRLLLAVLVLLVGAGVGIHAWRVRQARAKTLAGYVLDPPRIIPPITLLDSASHPVTLTSLGARGVALVYFGYSHCPDACPVTLADWQKVKRQLGAQARRVRFVFITVDPAHDTPRVLQDYLSHFDPDFVGLTGTQAALDSAQSALLVQTIEDDPMSIDSHSRGFAHQVALSLIDSLGRFRVALPVHTNARTTAADLERLLNAN